MHLLAEIVVEVSASPNHDISDVELTAFEERLGRALEEEASRWLVAEDLPFEVSVGHK